MREALASIPLARLRGAGLLDSLLRLAEGEETKTGLSAKATAELIDEMGLEELIRASVETTDAKERQAL